MALQSLVLCKDDEVLRQIRVILLDLGIGLQVCSRPEQALEELKRHKFELVIFDSDLSADTVLAGLRETHSNRTSVACTIGEQLGPKGPHDLVTPRPFAIEDAWRILRQARGLMEQEQQSYYREEVQLPVVLRWQEGSCLDAQGCNLSVSGMALSTALQKGLRLKVCFALASATFELDAEVTWSRDGRSGIHFLDLQADAKEYLENWIAGRRRQREYSFVKPFPPELDADLRILRSR